MFLCDKYIYLKLIDKTSTSLFKELPMSASFFHDEKSYSSSDVFLSSVKPVINYPDLLIHLLF